MSASRFPSHFENIVSNIRVVEDLTSIHRQIAGNTPGRKTRVEVLNKSAVVMLTACWESYVEDLVRNAFSHMLKNAPDHKIFPNSVLTKASFGIKNDNDARKVWDLAGDGWKKVLFDYSKTTLEKEIDHFHVPRPENIDALYSKLLGISNVTKEWKWKKMSNENAIITLNDFIDLRGEIAHNVRTNNSVWKKNVDDYLSFIKKASVILHNRVNSHIEKLLGKKAWRGALHGSVR